MNRVKARFLLGPAGSGKTFRCRTEVREALLASADGLPLLFLAPKQATFQLERQLLAAPALPGYTRLEIFSFERLAEFVVAEFSASPPHRLSEEGRLMVLRALLSQKRGQLKLFHATARLRGFAQQLSGVLREIQHARLTPENLAELARRADPAGRLDAKLEDLAVLLRAYLDWLRAHQLDDQDQLLAHAIEALDASGLGRSSLRIGGLWLDGFAEMTPLEMDLLMRVLPLCEQATLAFNLDQAALQHSSWLSTGSLVGQTYRQLHDRLAARTDIEVSVEWLERHPARSRFGLSPTLSHLEQHWSEPKTFSAEETASSAGQAFLSANETLRVVTRPTREGEVNFAARELRRFAREGGRYRDAAVIVRDLSAYHEIIRRVFTAWGIPFFLDRREPAGHHPLAELTRSALKTVALGWQAKDWFAALKTGLAHPDEFEIDQLENEALARGWQGQDWRQPFRMPDDPTLNDALESLRSRLMQPFERLASRLGERPSGGTMAHALKKFWTDLRVDEQLDQWSAEAGTVLHTAFWEQMQGWLENVELAFAREALPLRDWLPIIEAGLAAQTVGVVPLSLDQVLVGAVDRSRNPELRIALVLGLNESTFPAPPPAPVLLNEPDREQLTGLGARLGLARREQIGRERYLGYIACTRARERLILTCAQRDEEDHPLNPSPFIAHLQRLFPSLALETVPPESSWLDSEHPVELLSSGPREWRETLAKQSQILHGPGFPRFNEILARANTAPESESVSPGVASRLYGTALRTSVSRIEEFAACPFKYFVSSGLKAEERRRFELDARQRGSFQHEVLARFHADVVAEGKRWRDLTPAQARVRIRQIAATLSQDYQQGLLVADDQSRFTARSMTAALEEFTEVVVAWMDQYQFDPCAVELAFGQPGDPLPPWQLDLGEGRTIHFRGKIDRVDLCRDDETALCVVIDYKSSARKLDPVLAAGGVQLQLLAYLNVLRALPEAARALNAPRLDPAGVFYVSLRGDYERGHTRSDVLANAAATRKLAYQHSGRFDASVLRKLDRRPESRKGDQFKYTLTKTGELSKISREALSAEEFQALLTGVEAQLVRMGRAIYAGDARADPFRKGSDCACDHCPYPSVCRIDPWTHKYRVLRGSEKAASET